MRKKRDGVERLVGLVTMLLFWLVPISSSAEAAPTTVTLVLEGPWPAALAAAVEQDLQASLGERDIALARAKPVPVARPPAVIVRILAPEAYRAHIRIEANQGETFVERDVHLRDEPPDTWSVVLAASADELLGAFWHKQRNEVKQKSSVTEPPEPNPPPPEPAARPERVRQGGVGASVASDIFLDGATFLGADVFVLIPVGSRWSLQAALSGRELLPEYSEQGSVRASALGARAAARASLFSPGRLQLQGVVGLQALYVGFRAEPTDVSRARDVSGTLVALHAGPRLGYAMGPSLQLGLSVSAGYPLVRAVARDDETDVVALETMVGSIQWELCWWW